MKSKIAVALNSPHSKNFAKVQFIIALVTSISVLGIVLETVSGLGKYQPVFTIIEWATAVFFIAEYVARVATSKSKVRYIFSFWGIVDFVSVLPTVLGIANLTPLKTVNVLRILRLLRIFRLAKITRAYMHTQDRAKSEKELARLNTTVYFLALFTSVVGLGSLLYVIESSQKAYENIPLAMIQAAKIILGGLGQVNALTLAGELSIIVGRFVGLALFGLLISVVGKSLNGLLFGKDKN
jgi:voltage-gated potassium channel